MIVNMCVNPMSIKAPNGDWMLVPCGKCVECIKEKQNDTAVMCVREAEKCGSMVFVTLTYSNSAIPMYYNIVSVDEDNGELEWYGEPTRLPEDLEQEWRQHYFESHTDCFQFELAHCEEEDYDYIITPSLCRKDVQDWLKRARINYERHHGEKLNLKYLCCGEYGTNTGRPHFHLGLFGLTKEQAIEICDDWNQRLGHVQLDFVHRFENDGKDHYEATAKYIGKYIAKGDFESVAVKEHRAEKPRRMVSIDFGIKDDIDALNRFHLCYDLVGEYDPDDMKTWHFTPDQIKQLCNEIYKRKKYNLNGKDYKLPRKLQRRIFYRQSTETALDGTIKRKERSTEIWRLASRFIQHNLNKDFAEELQQARSEFNDEVPFEVIREIVHRQNAIRQDRAKTTFKNMYNSYRKSWF